MFKKIFIIVAVMIFSVLSGIETRAAEKNYDFVIVVNPDNPVSKISIPELQRIYKKQKQVWRKGGLIVPLDLDTTLFDSFYEKIFNEKRFEVDIYWMKQIFTRSLKPPLKKKTDDSVKKFIISNKNAIGYISIDKLDDTVKKVAITD